jgi:hypothetical protein
MNSASEDIKTMLEYYEQVGSGTSDSADDITLFPIYIGKEPAEPADVISIFETGSYGQKLTFDRTEYYEYTSFQIRIRANYYTDGWEQINWIKNMLHGRANETWGTTFYALIRCSMSPALLDYDKNQRVRFIVNFEVQRRCL